MATQQNFEISPDAARNSFTATALKIRAEKGYPDALDDSSETLAVFTGCDEVFGGDRTGFMFYGTEIDLSRIGRNSKLFGKKLLGLRSEVDYILFGDSAQSLQNDLEIVNRILD